MANRVTYEQTHSMLRYESETGKLYWKQRKGGKKPEGTEAGYRNDRGYIGIYLLGRHYRAHRVIWLMHTGDWPENEIDHINGIKDDNRISNLRDVCRSHNIQNTPGPRRNNSTGWLGVQKSLNRYRAAINVNGKNIHLGSFSDPRKAHEAYLDAKRRLHPGCVT